MTSICYVLPSKYPSGGNKIAIEHLERLSKEGFDCYISCVSKHKDEIEDWLPIVNVKEVEFKREILEEMDCVTATYWETVNYIEALKLEKPSKYYFVQSTEWEFFNDNVSQMKVWATLLNPNYTLLTEARWIQRVLQDKFRRQAHFVPNGLELPEVEESEYKSNKPIVLVEGNVKSVKKGIFDAAKAVRDLKGEAEIWLLTNSTNTFPQSLMGIFDKKFQGLKWKEALSVIQRADILLKPSHLEGQSGPIMEAMALGTAVVACNIPSVHELIIHEWDGVLVPTGDHFEIGRAHV